MAIVKISDLPLVDAPVEGTDLFVVVQDNVTKKAYASDIQTYVGFEEVQTATAGQTVFNLTTMTYAAGANNLMVFVDGVNQYEGSSYQETDNNTVTFTQGLHEGALVKFSTVQTQTSLVNNAAAVVYNPAGTGAVPSSVQTKLRETVSIKDFGAVGDGVVDDTVALQNAAKYASPLKATVVIPPGTYLIKGGINGITDSVPWLRLSMYGATFRFDTSGGAFDFLVDINELEIEGGQLGANGYDLGGSMTIRYNSSAQSYQSLKLNEVSFQTAAAAQSRCIFATAGVNVIDVEIRACNFRNFGRGCIEIRSNTISSSEARYWVENCYFKNLGNSSSLGCVAIQFGNNDNVVKNVTVKNNVFETISVTGGSICEVHAINVYGESAVIDGNHINDVRNDYGDDAEGIYVKCSYARIVNNYLRNGGNSHDGCVTVKGFGNDGQLQFTDYCVVSNNVIEYDSNNVDCPGIGVQRSFVVVSNNVLKDLRTLRTTKTYSIAMALGTAGYVNNITVSNNIVDGFVSFIGDATSPAFLTNNVSIESNVVSNLAGGYGIFYRNDARISNRSMIFSSADNSITFDQSVAFPGFWDYPTYQPGDQIRIVNSTSNDGVYTIDTYVDRTKITVVEPVVNQASDPADAYLVNSEPIRITDNNIRSNSGLFFIRNASNQCKVSLLYVGNNTISGFNYVYRLNETNGIDVCHIVANDYQDVGTALKFGAIVADTLIEEDVIAGSNLSLSSLAVTGNTVPANGVYLPSTNALGFSTATTPRMRISGTGEVIVNGSTALGAAGTLAIHRTTEPSLRLFRDDTTITSGNSFGDILWYGNDTTANTPTIHAYISALASGTHAAGDNPTDVVFYTTASGSATVREVSRINQAGNYQFSVADTGLQFSGGLIWRTGTGTPEGAVTAPVGSLFTRTDGGANTTLYVKESGAGNTGWVAK